MIVFNTFDLHLPIKLLNKVCLVDSFYRSKKNNCVNLMYFQIFRQQGICILS